MPPISNACPTLLPWSKIWPISTCKGKRIILQSISPTSNNMAANLRPLLNRVNTSPSAWNSCRALHFKVYRTRAPPLQEPRESPYIVGPYLKPDYVPRKYITEPIRHREINDFDHQIYKPIRIEPDQNRTVKLLLLDDVEGLGVAGQVLDVPYRYGASRLVALKKADYATEFTMRWHKFGPRKFDSASTAQSPRTVRLLANQIFPLPILSTTVVKPWHLSMALRLANCICPSEAIPQDSIAEFRDGDQLMVKCIVVINNHERVEVKFAFSKKEPEKAEKDDDYL